MSARGLPVSKLDHSRRHTPPPVAPVTFHPTLITAATPYGYTPADTSFTPANLRHAYGLDLLTGDGTGQTIAIIGAYDYPTAFTDLQAFDQQYGLPDPPSFRRVAQDGSTSNYPVGTSQIWAEEAALDVQWSHAMAPGANILLVEASSNSYSDLFAGAVNWARNQPGVSVVSMSFGQTGTGEFSTETPYDQWFTTPTNHAGVTFVASTGDSGHSASYPAVSRNVVAVGGTNLTLSGGDYAGESGWVGSSGGFSSYEAKPSYQFGLALAANSTKRAAPDIALMASPGEAVVYGGQWVSLYGTSLSAPLFAGMLAVADQLRVANGLTALNGRDTLLKLYSAPAADFHDITQGGNYDNSAGTGYDLATGLGSPAANLLLPDLAGTTGTISGHAYSDNNGNGVFDAGDTPLAGVRVYLDANTNGVYDLPGTFTASSGTLSVAIPDNDTFGATNTLTVSGAGGPITDVNVKLKINHTSDSQLSAFLSGPDGTQVQLFATTDGLSGANFTNTTFDDSATTAIHSGSAPFSGTYRPDQLLSAFNGKTANGAWVLEVIDNTQNITGTLISWSLSITSGPEASTWTAADGSYTLAGLSPATYTVRLNAPGTLATGPGSVAVSIHANSGTADFLQMPTTFTASGPNDQFYLWQDAGNYLIGKGTSAANPVYELPKYDPKNNQQLLTTALAFNLTSAGSKLYVDFATGAPIPQGNVTINGGGLATSELIVLGAGAPATTLTMTDTQLDPGTGGVLAFTNLGTLSLWNALVNYSGNLSTLQNLNVNVGTFFYWN